MLALMCHLWYLRSRLGQTSLVGLHVVSLYIEEQFTKRVALDNHFQERKKQGLVIGRYGSSTCRGSKSEIESGKGCVCVCVFFFFVGGGGISPVNLLHLEIFVGFKSRNFDFSRETHPFFSRQVAMHLGWLEVLHPSEFAPTLTQPAIKSYTLIEQKRQSCGHNETNSDKTYFFVIL